VGCSERCSSRLHERARLALTPALTRCAVSSTHASQDEEQVRQKAAEKIKEANLSLEEVVDEMMAAWHEANSLGFRSVPPFMHHTPQTVCPTARVLAAVLLRTSPFASTGRGCPRSWLSLHRPHTGVCWRCLASNRAAGDVLCSGWLTGSHLLHLGGAPISALRR
jgi:hypothetical protein